jgi:undecaprenyl diphosphate synthase
MNLLVEQFKKLINKKDNVKIVFSGSRDNLRKDVIDTINEIEKLTKNNNEHIFNICFNYGGRLDIIEAAKKFAIDYKNNVLNLEDLTEEKYYWYLMIPVKCNALPRDGAGTDASTVGICEKQGTKTISGVEYQLYRSSGEMFGFDVPIY